MIELSEKMPELITFVKKEASSSSRTEASVTVTGGNSVKILSSVFEKMSHIEHRTMALVGENVDTARMLCQRIEEGWLSKGRLDS